MYLTGLGKAPGAPVGSAEKSLREYLRLHGGWPTRLPPLLIESCCWQNTVNFCPSIRVFIGLTIVGWASMLWLARNEGCFLSAPRVKRTSNRGTATGVSVI
jgi:hypothetical protein